jgi:hypothetical protein
MKNIDSSFGDLPIRMSRDSDHEVAETIAVDIAR